MTETLQPIDRVHGLDTGRHARIVGAPGSGKTTALVEQAVAWLDAGRFSGEELLILAPSRVHATRLRDAVEEGISGVATGTIARTPVSLALALCNAQQQAAGEPMLQLMMGSKQDDVLRMALASVEPGAAGVFAPETLESVAFRTELRDLWRVLDEFSLSPADLYGYAEQLLAQRDTSEYLRELALRWQFLAPTLHQAAEAAAVEAAEQLPPSALLRRATQILGQPSSDVSSQVRSLIPELILIDDAADLSEGGLALLSALAHHGTKLWFFGDPDTATAAFAGEPTRVLSTTHAELERRGVHSTSLRGDEQVLLLDGVYRHGHQLRDFIRSLTERIGAAEGWQHRAAVSHAKHDTTVTFAAAHTFSEQLGVLAYRLRHRHLGLEEGSESVPWHEMAVLCRSSEQATLVADTLESLSVPTTLASGGIVLGQVPLVQHLLRLLQDALGLRELQGSEIEGLLLGPVGGLDPVALRRLDHAVMLGERREAFTETRSARSRIELYAYLLEHPEAIADLAEGRALRRVSNVIAAGRASYRTGQTARQTLWALWEATGLQQGLTERALNGAGVASAQAHRNLDALVELFFSFQRHEELASEQPIEAMIEELLASEVPQDSIATRSSRPAVTVTTPQGAAGREFQVVCIAGPQEGTWPNMRSRGSLVGSQALQTLLRGNTPQPFDRQHLLHEELRLFASACSRASRELLVVAREDDDEFPSQFFHLGGSFLSDNLPQATLTLRGQVAQLRRELTAEEAPSPARRQEVAAALAYLAENGVSGSDPADWYGIRKMSTDAPLVDLNDPEARVSVSPSRIETAEACPLNWFVSTFASGPSNVSAQLGTLIHHALETATGTGELELKNIVDAQWSQLEFDAPWQETLFRENASRMVEGLADYLRDRETEGASLIAREAGFAVTIDQAVVRGLADRIELVHGADGQMLPAIVDLKTGTSFPSQASAADNPQLLSYQLGLLDAPFLLHSETGETEEHRFEASAGASLLFVHPKATTQRKAYRLVSQPALTPEKRAEFESRVREVAQVMAAGAFEAQVEHHCVDPHQFGACKLHIIPAVSYE